MAVTATLLTSGTSGANTSPKSTASVTLVAGRLYVLITPHASAFSSVGTTATAFAQLGSGIALTTPTPDMFMQVWWVIPTADDTDAIDMTHSGAGVRATWAVIELEGFDPDDPFNSANHIFGDNGESASTGFAVTIPNAFFDANSATLGAFQHQASELATPGSGFTELADVNGAETNSLIVEFRNDNDASVDASWSTSSLGMGFGVEIKAEPAGGAVNISHTAGSLAIAGGTHAKTAQKAHSGGNLAIAGGTQAKTAAKSHAAGSLALAGGTHAKRAEKAHTAGTLALNGSTHGVSAGSVVGHVAGSLALAGGTQSKSVGKAHAAGSLALAGGTHGKSAAKAHSAGSLAIVAGVHIRSFAKAHAGGNLAIQGGTHELEASNDIAHVAGSLAISGGTHSQRKSKAHVAGSLAIAGGVHFRSFTKARTAGSLAFVAGVHTKSFVKRHTAGFLLIQAGDHLLIVTGPEVLIIEALGLLSSKWHTDDTEIKWVPGPLGLVLDEG